MKINKRLYQGLGLAVATALLLPVAAQVAEAAGAEASGTINQPNAAARELERENRLRERQSKGMSVPVANLYLSRAEVTVEGNKHMSEAKIRALLPELEKEEISVHRLSLQIMLANSSGGLQLTTKLRPMEGGKFAIRVLVEEKKDQSVIETVTNGGNQYTGDWRMITSYVNTNLTGRADTLGVSYVTAPGHWEDVKQAAVTYRYLLPKAGGELNFNAGWSDVDLGKVADLGADATGRLEMYASGKSNNVGLSYVHHLSYSSKEKDSWEFGFEHKQYKNKWNWRFSALGKTLDQDASKYDFSIDTFNVRFRHQEHKQNRFFGWNAGLVTNFTGDKAKYELGTKGSDTRFTILRGGAQYQYRTKSNWLASAKVVGQYTESNLISPEKLGAGGMYTLRGFNERTMSADRGLLGTLEFYTPELMPKLRGLVFADFASLHNNFGSWQHEAASSAGLGLRWTDRDNGLYVSLDYVAKIMDDIRAVAKSQPGYKRWNLVLTKVF